MLPMKKYQSPAQPLLPKAKTRKEVADELGISVATLWRKLKKLGIELPPGLIYPPDQALILATLGQA